MNIVLSFSEKQMADLCKAASDRNVTLEELVLSCCLNVTLPATSNEGNSIGGNLPISSQIGERVSSLGGLFSFTMPVRAPVSPNAQNHHGSLNMNVQDFHDDEDDVNEIVVEYESEEELNEHLAAMDNGFF